MTSMHSLRFMEQWRKFATSSTTVRSSDNGNHKNWKNDKTKTKRVEIVRIETKQNGRVILGMGECFNVVQSVE